MAVVGTIVLGPSAALGAVGALGCAAMMVMMVSMTIGMVRKHLR